MSAYALSLVITTPLAVITKVEGVTSFRASDDSGSFGVMPGHCRSSFPCCATAWRAGGRAKASGITARCMVA